MGEAFSMLPPETDAPSHFTPRDKAFNRIHTCMEYAGSYTRSASEMAWRGDEVGLERELQALRACVLEAIKSFKVLGNG